MMEPSMSTGKASSPPMLSPRTTDAAPSSTTANAPSSSSSSSAPTTGASSAAPSSTTSTTSTSALQGGFSGASFKMPPVPKVIKDKTDDFTTRIVETDIKRINGYMRFANLGAALLLGVTCFIRMFMVHSYSDFLVVIYIMGLAAGLVFVENHEMFPSVAEKVKNNFGFMFTAVGKAGYILAISFLSFSQGWIGTLLGLFFLILALFNFFLIYRHPAYQAHMTNTQNTQDQADLEAMPELRYNQSQQPAAQSAHVVV